MCCENSVQCPFCSPLLLLNSWIPSNKWSRNFSFEYSLRPMPTTANFSGIQSSRNKLYKAGVNFLLFKSPLPPKIKIADAGGRLLFCDIDIYHLIIQVYRLSNFWISD